MYKSIKTMTEALKEARAYRDPVKEDKGFSSQQIKMAYGVLNDPRYKGGNYSGAFKAIEKIAKGLASHPDVANALKRANEELEEKMKLRWDKDKEGWYDKKGRRRYLSIGATNAIMRKGIDKAVKTGDWTDMKASYEQKEELEEELIIERRYMVTDYFFSDRGQVGLSVVVDAANENQAEKKALDKIEKLRDSPLARRKGVDDPTDMGMDVEITNKPLNYTDIEKDTRS